MTTSFQLKKRRFLVYVEPPTVGGLLTSCISHDPINMKFILNNDTCNVVVQSAVISDVVEVDSAESQSCAVI